MNGQRLAILAAVTAILAGGAFLATRVRERAGAPAASPLGGAYLLDAARERVADIARVEVRSGDRATTLTGSGDVWSIGEMGGYPARAERVRALLTDLLGARVLEEKTSRPDLYSRLGVEDPAPGAASRLVTLKDASGGTIASVIIGQSRPGATGGERATRYVRRAGEPAALLVSGGLDADADPIGWTDRRVLEIPADRFVGASVTNAAGERIEVAKSPDETGADDDAFALTTLPEGRAVADAGAPARLAAGASMVTFEDARPAAEIAFDDPTLVTTVYRTGDGLAITARSVERDAKVWTAWSAAYEEPAPAVPHTPEAPAVVTPPPPPPAPLLPEANATGDITEPEPAAPAPAAAPEPAATPPPRDPVAAEALRAEAAALNARLAPWAYAIPSYKTPTLRPTLESLLAPLPTPSAAGPTAPE